MSSAEEDYREAEARIENARKANDIGLSFLGLTELAVIPRNIRILSKLEHLDLRRTKITNIAPLEPLSRLQALFLANTPIVQIDDIRSMPTIDWLDISDTRISDIQPLQSLPLLKALIMHGSQVRDLRPLLSVKSLWERDESMAASSFYGLSFDGTPATKSDPTLFRLAQISDNGRRATETRHYLETLPPWPSRLADNDVGSDTEAVDLDNPSSKRSKPAPVMVRSTSDGQIVLDPPDIGLEDPVRDRAEQAWTALRAYLDDLRDLRDRLHNMPNLARAFDSFERAMGTEFETLNQIDLGMQADRIRRLAVGADRYLMDQDPDELNAFTAALALYTRRFNDWDAYQNEDPPNPEEQAHLKEDRPAFKEVETGLAETGQVSEPVLEALEDVMDIGTGADATEVEQRGALDSMSNTLGEVAEQSMSVKEQLGNKTDEFFKELQSEAASKSRDWIYAIPGAARTIWFVAFMYNNRGHLEHLAARYPERFGFLLDVLRYLFPV